MNISLSHRSFCFILQEVYDWAGGADESHKERLEGPEVLSFVERVSMVYYHLSYLDKVA